MSSIWYAIKYPVKLKFPLIEKKNAISYVHAFKNEATFFTAIKWNWKYILDEILFKAPPVYFFLLLNFRQNIGQISFQSAQLEASRHNKIFKWF